MPGVPLGLARVSEEEQADAAAAEWEASAVLAPAAHQQQQEEAPAGAAPAATVQATVVETAEASVPTAADVQTAMQTEAAQAAEAHAQTVELPAKRSAQMQTDGAPPRRRMISAEAQAAPPEQRGAQLQAGRPQLKLVVSTAAQTNPVAEVAVADVQTDVTAAEAGVQQGGGARVETGTGMPERVGAGVQTISPVPPKHHSLQVCARV